MTEFEKIPSSLVISLANIAYKNGDKVKMKINVK